MPSLNCPCGAPLLNAPSPIDINALSCQQCGYLHTVFTADYERDYLQSGNHPSAFQGHDGKRFGSLIGWVRHQCASYRVRRSAIKQTVSGIKSSIIDFGCGQGYFLDALKSNGHQCLGVEINEITARQAMSKGHQVTQSLNCIPFDQYNAVASVHVLEHIPEPVPLLIGLGTRIKPGDRFYFEVPNFESWQARLFRYRWLHCEAGLHIHHFTRASFLGLLKSSGFKTERVATYSFEHGLLGWVQSILNVAFPYNRFFRLVVLNHPLKEKLRCWPELLLMPVLIPLGLILLWAEALAGHGAVLRVEGIYAPKP